MKVYKSTQEKLVKSLIADYLTNFRLITGLNDLGLKADRYDVQLGDTIFKLMGLEAVINNNDLQEAFYKFSKNVKKLDLVLQPEAFMCLVNDIYEWLKKEGSKYEKA